MFPANLNIVTCTHEINDFPVTMSHFWSDRCGGP